MDLVLHTVCFNEEKMLPYFLNHYSNQVKKIRIYDNQSTDRSVEIASSYSNVEVLSFDTQGKLSELTLMHLRNEAWKEETCDYMIVCDVDEFLYPSDIHNFLLNHPEVDVFQPQGYDMVCDDFPSYDGRSLTDIVRWGCPAENYSKMVCFKPERLININYGPGSHLAAPTGHDDLNIYKAGQGLSDMKLLHFKNLGFEYRLQRHQILQKRLGGQEFEKYGFGFHYAFDSEAQKIEFLNLKKNAVQVFEESTD